MLLIPFLTVGILFVSLTALLPQTLKRYQYVILYITILTCYPLISILRQTSTYIVLFCSVFLISLFSKDKLANVTLALFGYLFNVTLNQFVLTVIAYVFGITVSSLVGYKSLFFQTFYLALLIGLFRFLRRKFQRFIHLFLQKDYRFFCIALVVEEILYTGLYAYFIVYGEKLGYTPAIIVANGLLFSLLFFSVIILLLCVHRSLEKEYAAKQELAHMQELESYTMNLEKLYKLVQSMNHDYKNLFSTACSFIDTGDFKGLRTFYSQTLATLSQNINLSEKEIGSLSNIQIMELKGLLYNKTLTAITLNINLKLRIDYLITSAAMNTTDLIRILGIYLDNAIEAAQQTEAKELFIYFSKTNENTCWTISNSFSDSDLPLSRINEYGFSTKGSGRGVGLYTVSEILKRYPHILSNTSINASVFSQSLQHI